MYIVSKHCVNGWVVCGALSKTAALHGVKAIVLYHYREGIAGNEVELVYPSIAHVIDKSEPMEIDCTYQQLGS